MILVAFVLTAGCPSETATPSSDSVARELQPAQVPPESLALPLERPAQVLPPVWRQLSSARTSS